MSNDIDKIATIANIANRTAELIINSNKFYVPDAITALNSIHLNSQAIQAVASITGTLKATLNSNYFNVIEKSFNNFQIFELGNLIPNIVHTTTALQHIDMAIANINNYATISVLPTQKIFENLQSFLSIIFNNDFQAIFTKGYLKNLNINPTFLGIQLDLLNSAMESEETNEICEKIGAIEENFNKAIEMPPTKKSIISLEGILGFALTIFLTIRSDNSQKEMEDRIKATMGKNTEIINEAIKNSETNILSKIDQYMNSIDPSGSYYVVERTTKIFIKPNTKSQNISTVHPNQKLKIEKFMGKWLYVSYFDLINGITRTGWIGKKYLKRIN